MGIYKYSYRFNAMHDTSLGGDGRHTHSFEVVFYIEKEITLFYQTENTINAYMERYVGKFLNTLMDELPTVEHIAEKIFSEINAKSQDFSVVRLEISDSPVQTYIIGAKEI